ncbi:MAG: hypothetical protein JKY61_00770 [Planctomycetes bacterium]|nr:hypothetical protein [Planctomycetota bacterium]
MILLSSCSHVSSWPPAVSSAQEIEQLPTSQTDVRAIGIGEFELRLIGERFPKLDYLYLNPDTHVTDEGLVSIAQLKHLQQVVIEEGSNLSDASIATLASMPAMTELILHNGTLLTDDLLKSLGTRSNLRLLYLIDCPQFHSPAKQKLERQLATCNVRFE